MTLVPLDIDLPPGIAGNGTKAQASMRWWRTNLVRWLRDGVSGRWTLRAVRGWRRRSTSAASGKVRALLAWGSGVSRFIALGSHTKLYTQTPGGALTDRTPSGFTTGRADAIVGAGYGAGNYGAGAYGTMRPDTGSILEASMWTFDTLGDVLICCMSQDGDLYEWDASAAPAAATQITNAPTGCGAVFVSPENAVVALAANGDPTLVQYSDRNARTTWTPAVTNKAGDFNIKSKGALLCGAAVGRRSILHTTLDAWVMEKREGILVYAYDLLAEGCGIVSRGAGVNLPNGQRAWMSPGAFKLFDGGAVRDAPNCTVLDRVWEDINTSQLTKIVGRFDPQTAEVRWSYPSSGSTENDRQVVWNIREGVANGYWYVDEIARTALGDRGVFNYPLSVDVDGWTLEDEAGWDYDDAVPYASTGPLDLGSITEVKTDRGRKMAVRYIEADGGEGAIEATLTFRDRAEGDESSNGPLVLTEKTPVPSTDTARRSGREVDVRFDFTDPITAELGVVRLHVIPRASTR